MKKLYFILFACLYMFNGLNGFSQTLNGKWTADKATTANFGLNEDKMKSSLFLSFDGKETVVSIELKVYEKGVGTVGVLFGMPGSYTQTGSMVNSKFRKNDFSIKLSDMDLEDPELKGLMESNPEMKDMLFNTIFENYLSNDKDAIDDMKSICDMFSSFKIVSCTADKLVITIGNDTLTFKKSVN